uniref:Amino acid transporter transmembrane domain-containing protein n=1 Tax=Oryza punctata TaxID=4537 RepID=A0A0E0KFE9_ORYPU
MSVALVWLYAFFLTVGGEYKNAAPKTQFHCRTDRSRLVGGAPWISVPYPFQWGAPTFDAGEAFAMIASSFVALVECNTMPSCYDSWHWLAGKFGAVFASISGPIIAAIYCLVFAYVGMAGVRFLQFCNLNSFRTKFVVGFSVFMCLSVPQYFNEYTSVAGYGPVHTHARWLNDMINVLFSSIRRRRCSIFVGQYPLQA